MNLAKWISMTEAFECFDFAPSSKEVVKAAEQTGGGQIEGVILLNNCDSMSLYNRRGEDVPHIATSNTMLPKNMMIASSPRRLYNRRGPVLPAPPTSPPVLSNPRSVLKKTVSKEELQQPGGPYMKKTFTIDGDVLGWGFVVRGNRPCHIQTVEPHGPAAVAGMKVCQFVVSINNQNVLDMDYKTINQLILNGPRKIFMEVMEEKKD